MFNYDDQHMIIWESLPQKSMPLSTTIPDNLFQEIMVISVIFDKNQIVNLFVHPKITIKCTFSGILCQFGRIDFAGRCI